MSVVRIGFGVGSLARLLVVVMLAGSLPSANVFAQDPAPVTLAIPADTDLATDATLQPSDAPPAVPDPWEPEARLVELNTAFDALDPADWDVAGLAASLGADPAAAFALVRDRIGLDAYAGSLRGAEGTYSARAGNAVDRALLLQALLVANGTPARLAFGDLEPSSALAVLVRSLEAVADPLPTVDGLGLPAGTRQDVATRARRDHALLRAALATTPDASGDQDVAAAIAEIRAHAWVQAQIDGTWVDLDPTLLNAQPGDTLTTAASTADTLPEALRQTVTIRLTAETVTDGYPETALVLERTLDAATAADRQVLLLFGPSTGGGGGLLSVGGPEVVIPVLMVDGQPWTGTEFVVQADVSDGMLGGSSEVDLASLVLELSSEVPGQEPWVSRSVLIDRVPAAAREAGTLDRASLLPVDGPVTLPNQLQGVRHVLISTGGVSPRAAAWNRSLATASAIADADDPASTATMSPVTAYWPTGVADQELVVASELDAIPGVDDDAVRAFAARPRVYLVTVTVDPADPTRIEATTDLMLDHVRILARPGAGPGAVAQHQLWYGALQTAIETELARRTSVVFEPDTLQLTGVSLGVDAPLTVLSAADAASLPDTTAPSLRASLDAGSTILVAGDPGLVRTWWEVRPDGGTRSVLAPDAGGIKGVGGPRVPPVRNPNPNPNNPNPKPPTPKPVKKPPTRTPSTRPTQAKECSGGNESIVVNRCVAFVNKITMEHVFLAVLGLLMAAVVVGVVLVFTGSI